MIFLIDIAHTDEFSVELIKYFRDLRDDVMGVEVDIKSNLTLNPDYGNLLNEYKIALKVASSFILPLDISIFYRYYNWNSYKKVLRITIEPYSGKNEWVWAIKIAKDVCKAVDAKISIFDKADMVLEEADIIKLNTWCDSFSIEEYSRQELIDLKASIQDKVEKVEGINRTFYIGSLVIKKIFSSEDYLRVYRNLMHSLQYQYESSFFYDKIKISGNGKKNAIIVFVLWTLEKGIVYNHEVDFLLLLDKNIEANSNLIRLECDRVKDVFPEECFIDENSFFINCEIMQHWDEIIEKAKNISSHKIKNEFYPPF